MAANNWAAGATTSFFDPGYCSSRLCTPGATLAAGTKCCVGCADDYHFNGGNMANFNYSYVCDNSGVGRSSLNFEV